VSTPIATVQYGKVFDSFEQRLRTMQTNALADSGNVLRREVETSIRARWYRTGASLGALGKGEVTSEDNKLTYRLLFGKFYDVFGEYGTGRRGAASGQPAPKGYTYGDKPGMAARRFGRLPIDATIPQIRDLHLLAAREFARGVTK
jgi:hypothetical protein